MQRLIAVGALGFAVGLPIDGWGQDAADDSEAQQTGAVSSLEEITVVGSRRQTRTKMGTLAPVDVIDISDLGSQNSQDMTNMLRTFVPAFNVNEQPISDAATLIRPANLRGLPPDMTVVLVNGKRRHRGAVISFLGGGVSDGAQGVDISVIPSIALARVEVLRDGAAAQYGADAIAGVMNFVLRENREGLAFQAQYGSTYAGDGDSLVLAGNWGLPLTDEGFLNLSLEFSSNDPTSRSVQRADAAILREGGNNFVPRLAQVWGNPEVQNNVKFFANGGLNIGEDTRAYMFGNYASRTVLGGFFYRNPDRRGGVFSNDGGVTRLVADLTPNDPFGCPTVPVGDTAALDAVASDPNCFVFNELFPGGFTPQFGGDISDLSVAAGVRGELDLGLRWDLSASVGQSDVDFRITNTINASLGPQTPTEFRPGGYRQTDQNLNLDLVYPVDVGFLYSPLNIAGGFEYREERFTIFEGDRKAFEVGPFASQGFSTGSNGFPGFSTQEAGSFTRRNAAGYLDLEADVMPWWIMAVAGRVEHFDTFGTTATAKASTRFSLLEDGLGLNNLSLRATAGTGFRAPTPGQANVTNVTTVGNADGSLTNRATIPPTNSVAVSKGGKELDPETSINAGAGVVAELFDDLSLTVDYYWIKVDDRISQSANQNLTPAEAQQLEDEGTPGAAELREIRFFTNAFDTITQGIDVVGTYAYDWGTPGQTNLSLAYNWNQTSVDAFDPEVIDEERILQLEDSLPQHRFVASLTHAFEGVRFLARLNYFGEFKSPETTRDFTYGGQWMTDFELAYTVQQELTLVAGVRNAFDTFPDDHPNARALGNKYPENAPAGTNGGFWYTRVEARF